MEENYGYTKEQLDAWEIGLTISNIQHAISEEEKEAKKPLAFKIVDLSENGVVYRITVDGIENNKNGYLDENRLRGASATLDGVPNIFIKIHIVTSEEDQLELPLADLYRPYIGQKILIHPKNFLAELRESWAEPVWSVKAYECMADL